ncbi:hypothetical protein [uncultured Limosilactobacillus sp.]|uniref:hypothetical protein n=1 Tax=uncultured Limosilactobacillus sp. TaxID=2837629 RepID=UPI0025FE0D93|nr:hypothetical protein [uncultured Limosilactobacillus sp.]
MEKWWRQPLAAVTSLPLILAAGRWDWLTMLRLVGQAPTKLTLDSEVFWLLLGAVCFVLNVFNLLMIYQQAEPAMQTTQYRAASWLLAILLMAGLVVCWSHPASLILPTRLTWLLVVATIIAALQALVGNYFLLVTTVTKARWQPLVLPTLTWLVAAILGWPTFSTAGVVIAVVAVIVLVVGHALNLPRLLATAVHPVDQLVTGVVIASGLSAVFYGLTGGCLLWKTRTFNLFVGVLLTDLLLLAGGSQWLGLRSRLIADEPAQPWAPRWLFAGTALVVAIELAGAGMLLLI